MKQFLLPLFTFVPGHVFNEEVTDRPINYGSEPAPGADGVLNTLQCRSERGILLVVTLLNARFCLIYFSEKFKKALITIISEPGKDTYRAYGLSSISLLSITSKLFEHFVQWCEHGYLRRLDAFIPKQFGLQAGHVTTQLRTVKSVGWLREQQTVAVFVN